MAEKQNLFQWEVKIDSLDALHRLHLILAYHLMGEEGALNDIYLRVTIDEKTASHIHEEIKEFVETRGVNSTLTLCTEGEESFTINYPLNTYDDIMSK